MTPEQERAVPQATELGSKVIGASYMDTRMVALADRRRVRRRARRAGRDGIHVSVRELPPLASPASRGAGGTATSRRQASSQVGTVQLIPKASTPRPRKGLLEVTPDRDRPASEGFL